MFDLAWSEIALIAVVALVVIGPKDLPDAIRGVAKGIQKLRRMAGEFQGHVDEMVREAKLEEVRDQINQVRNFDIRGEFERAVDNDGTIRKAFQDDPFKPPTTTSYGPPAPEGVPGGAAPPAAMADTFGPPGGPPAPPAEPAPPTGPPAFIPPEAVRAAEAAKPAAAAPSSPPPATPS